MSAKSVNLIFTDSTSSALAEVVEEMAPSAIFLLADTNTAQLIARPLLESTPALAGGRIIEIPAGDQSKNVDTLSALWQALSDGGATRSSLLINVGGGMVTDLGGFAASTFKRGIRFINIPTTLLGAVDAALGGKTGINFNGLKNEIGVFSHADAVIVSARHFATLPYNELTSGYAELLKHALIDSPEALNRALAYDLERADLDELQHLLRESIAVKERIVAADPLEHGLRKALNLGHTAAHAFESLAMEEGRAVAHGHAVAWGLIVDLILSNMMLGLDSATLHDVAIYIKEYFPRPQLSCADYPRLIELMRHDKKNLTASRINFTLLSAPGQIILDNEVTPEKITPALDILRDLLC